MRHLFRWTFICIAAFGVVLAAIIESHRKAHSRIDFLLTNPNGSRCELPCLFGAQPDTMSYSMISWNLAQHPLLRGMQVEFRINMYDFFFGQTVNVTHMNGLVSIIFHEPPQCLDYPTECRAASNTLLLKSLRKSLPLSAIIEDFGIPNFIVLDTSNQGESLITLCYGDHALSFTFKLSQPGVINPADPMLSIDLHSKDAFAAFSRSHPHYEWPGYGPLDPSVLKPA